MFLETGYTSTEAMMLKTEIIFVSWTMIGYKSFSFNGVTELQITYRGTGGNMRVVLGEKEIGTIPLTSSEKWIPSGNLSVNEAGIFPLYFFYDGCRKIDILDFNLTNGGISHA